MAIDKVEISTQTEDVELYEDIYQDEQTIKGIQIEEYRNYCFCCNYSYCKCKAKNHFNYFCSICKYYKCYKGKGGIYKSKNGMYWKKDNNGKDRMFDNRFHQIKLPWE
jgi:hypothetical protein